MQGNESASLKFNSPQEEIAYLRSQVLLQERIHESSNQSYNREEVIKEKLKEHSNLEKEDVLANPIPQNEHEAIVLDLSPKETDKKIEELLGILETKGLLNTLRIIESSYDAKLEDDFHRVLVQYVKKNLPVSGVSKDSTLFHSLFMTLFEVTLPFSEDKDKKPLKELVSSMEQFYAGVIPHVIGNQDRWISFEIAVRNDRKEVVFYVAVPDEIKGLFEKQFSSIFPNGKIREEKNDFNIFKDKGYLAASYASYKHEAIFRLKCYQEFDYDPLTIILNAFSKIKDVGEGAALQFLVAPASVDYISRYKKALDDLNKGVSLKTALNIPETLVGDLGKEIGSTVKGFFGTSKKQEEKVNQVDQKIEEAKKSILQKIETPIISSGIRIVVSAESKERAESVISDIEATFHQFENTLGNSLIFKRYQQKEIKKLIEDFTFRVFEKKESMPMSLRELSTLFHFPTESASSVSELKYSKGNSAPPPQDLDKNGIVLGINRHRSVVTEINFGAEDRLRHFYCIGQTGTGKSTLLKSMIIQDIKNGEGVCMIDPHGSDIEDVLASIPKERIDDVIYFNPGYTDKPMGLNMLEYDTRFPEQKTFVVNELIAIFNKLFDMKVAGGPAFEQYFRNSALLVMEHPQSGSTLLEITRVLSDKSFRDLKLSYCKNPIITQFWQTAERTTGEQALSNFVPYISNKFDPFISNDIMRPIIAQEKSAFNFRDIMDKRKILLVNLSKGRLGDINANLIGLIVVGKILMATLSRVDSFGKSLPPFYLYIDEFQNITTDSIATILSEARKYKLSLNIAHQFIAQLEEKIRDAVFGNVGSIATFRVGTDDAEYLEKQFSPNFTQKDIMNLDNYQAYLKLLVKGRPGTPFNIETPGLSKLDASNVSLIKEKSYSRFGKSRSEIEENIISRYQKK
ncbi:MAG: TraM recognition domain-containing protein [Patescibacteria group bacterium]